MNKKRRLLIVDDNPDIHEDFKKILLSLHGEKDGETQALEKDLFGAQALQSPLATEAIPTYEIDDAYQGEEAVAMVDRAEAQKAPYALVFMDVRMPPGIDGIETISLIWKKHPHVEVIICTAYSDYSWEKIVQKFGNTDKLLFIKKPFDAVTVRQISLAVSTKWELGFKNRHYLQNLEKEVEKRTAELRSMMNNLSELKDRAEAAVKAKGQFLANMSHEIRTPMNAVIGFAELLRTTSLTPQQIEYVNAVGESGELLISLINDILDLSKIESHKITLEDIDFDLEYCIVGILKILRQRVGSKPVDLNIIYPESVPRFLKGDPTRIRQIFMNLIGNAIKFTDEGDVTTRVELNAIDSDKGEKILKLGFSVKDTGIGIPLEKQHEIFEAFTQVDASITRKYGGTGLGLTITKSLVEQMGGEISVRSAPGKGAEFFFHLILSEGRPVMEKNITPIDPDRLKGRKVIIVDDNAQAREIISSFCSMAGLEIVLLADSAEKVLEWLASGNNTPDIILSDIMMPVMDGYTLAKRIRSMADFNEVRLIALTNDATPGSAERSQQSGFNAYLSKPFTKIEFLDLLRTVFGDLRADKRQIITRHLTGELSTKGVSVLVVEDNTLNQKVMGLLLKQIGCVYEIAGNGKEAVEKLRGKSYNLIFMDLQMPVMDGIAATAVIRGDMNVTTPIIALTAHVFPEDQQKCLEAGMNDFLTKPVTIKALREKMIQWASA